MLLTSEIRRAETVMTLILIVSSPAFAAVQWGEKEAPLGEDVDSASQSAATDGVRVVSMGCGLW